MDLFWWTSWEGHCLCLSSVFFFFFLIQIELKILTYHRGLYVTMTSTVSIYLCSLCYELPWRFCTSHLLWIFKVFVSTAAKNNTTQTKTKIYLACNASRNYASLSSKRKKYSPPLQPEWIWFWLSHSTGFPYYI